MWIGKKWARVILAAVIAIFLAAPASASTFARAGLDHLVAKNSTIVVGEAMEASSYWNEPGTLILTDVRFVVAQVLKGNLTESEITVTLPGGTVGSQTSLVVGGAELVPGRSYVLFLVQQDLPGLKGARTVRDHSQGVFEIRKRQDGLRAVSQASVGHTLVADALGKIEPPGGTEGVPFHAMLRSIHERVDRGEGREVK
jgi:hypothetical protein